MRIKFIKSRPKTRNLLLVFALKKDESGGSDFRERNRGLARKVSVGVPKSVLIRMRKGIIFRINIASGEWMITAAFRTTSAILKAFSIFVELSFHRNGFVLVKDVMRVNVGKMDVVAVNEGRVYLVVKSFEAMPLSVWIRSGRNKAGIKIRIGNVKNW